MKNKRLTEVEMDMLFVIAGKDGNVVQHYKRYYSDDIQPDNGLLGILAFNVMQRFNGLQDALVYYRGSSTKFLDDEKTLDFNELMYQVFKVWALNVTIYQLAEWCPNYEEIIREERASYKEKGEEV